MNSALAAVLAAVQPAPAEPAPAPVPPFIQAERSFAASAQLFGQWSAFRAYAAPDAIMMNPGPVNAHQFLARFRTDPPIAVMWWPGKAWVSCDGSMAVTTGPWVRKGGTQVGTFTTVWRREPDGSWKWVYDHGRRIPRALEPPEVPPVQRASCPGGREERGDGIWLQMNEHMPGKWGYPLEPLPSSPPVAQGQAADGTLRWAIHHRPQWGPDAYTFQVFQRIGGGTQLVIAEGTGFTVPPPPLPPGADPEAALPPLAPFPPPERSPYLPRPRDQNEPPGIAPVPPPPPPPTPTPPPRP